MDLHDRDARRIGREISRRLVDDGEHLLQDEGAAALRLRERRKENVARDAGNLDVHLNRRHALLRACDLEVHIAECVLHALNVRQDRIVVAVLDEPHGDARHGTLDRNARVHQRERAAADASHGA